MTSKPKRFRFAAFALLLVGGCIDLDIVAPDSLIPIGSPFVLSGTTDVLAGDTACLVWLGENGIAYHLFQDSLLDNDLFDAVTTPGTTARLELTERTDLDVACQVGVIADVTDVLEIVE